MFSKEQKSFTAYSVFTSMEGLIFESAIGLIFLINIIALNQSFNLSDNIRKYILNTTGSISFIVWLSLSFSIWKDRLDKFFITLKWGLVIIGPIGLLINFAHHPFSEILFWWNLVVWNILTIRYAISEKNENNKWETLVLTLSMIWGVSCAMITLGSLSWFPFSNLATNRLTSLSHLADVRFAIALVIICLISIAAVIRSLTQKSPELKNMEPWEIPIPETNNYFFSIIPPVMHVINVVMLVFHAIVELIWKAVQLFVIFFGRVGIEISIIVKTIVAKKVVWLDTGRSILSLILFILAFFAIKKCSSSWYSYLSTSIWKKQLYNIPPILLTIFLILVCVWIITILVERINMKSESIKPVGDATIKSLGWLCMAYLLGNVLVYGYCHVMDNVCGYEKIGILTTLLVLIILSGMIYSIGSRKTK